MAKDRRVKRDETADGTAAERLHAIMREPAIEREPGRRETLRVAPDSLLDRHPGIDSLDRPELSLRIGSEPVEEIIAGPFLWQLGTAFVERFDSAGRQFVPATRAHIGRPQPADHAKG